MSDDKKTEEVNLDTTQNDAPAAESSGDDAAKEDVAEAVAEETAAEVAAASAKKHEDSAELTKRLQKLALDRQKVSSLILYLLGTNHCGQMQEKRRLYIFNP